LSLLWKGHELFISCTDIKSWFWCSVVFMFRSIQYLSTLA
jgi:hypothetical protein